MSKTMPPKPQPTEQSASDQQIQADGVPRFDSETDANRRARAKLKRYQSQYELTDKYGTKVPAQLPSRKNEDGRELVMREMMQHHAERDVALVRGALAAETDRCPYKRNTRDGKDLAARWDKGRKLAVQLRAEAKAQTVG